MVVITLEDIKESDRLKREKCSEMKEAMKNILSEEQLEKFEDVFYIVTNGYLLKRKGD